MHYRFVYLTKDINMDCTPDMLNMNDDSIIYVTAVDSNLMFTNTVEVQKLLDSSAAPMVLRITLANGATVRSGIEIEENSQVRVYVIYVCIVLYCIVAMVAQHI